MLKKERAERYLRIDIKSWIIQGDGFAMIQCFAKTCKAYIKKQLDMLRKELWILTCLTAQQGDMVMMHHFFPPPKDLSLKNQKWIVRMKSLYIETLLGCQDGCVN